MMNKLVIYPPDEAYKNEKLIFFNNFIKEKTSNEILNLSSFDVAKSYGLDENLVKNDTEYLEKIYDKFIKILTNHLNTIHSENKSERYWSIILGQWLIQLIRASYNRYQTLGKAFKEFNINNIVTLDDNEFVVADEYTDYFKDRSIDVLFDAILISKIIDFSKYKNKVSKKIKIKKNFSLYKNSNSNLEIKTFFKTGTKNLFKFFNIFKKNNDAFIVDTYLPFFKEKKLQMEINKFPQYWKAPKFIYEKYDQRKRDMLKFDLSSSSEFEAILLKIIKDYLPIAALESYKKLTLFIKQLPWPKNPKFILTANSFAGNDVYKFWIADKTENGSPYFVCQHGFGYLEYVDKKMKVEFKTSDKFFSWGNFSHDKKIVPLFNLTLCEKEKKNEQGDKLIFVLKAFGHRIQSWDRFGLGDLFEKKTVYLLENIKKEIKKNTILRLHPNWKKEGLHKYFENFLKNNQSIEINESTKYFELIKKSRLVIFNDLSTGFLQNLSLNCPSVCYLPVGLIDLHDENKKDYIDLIKNKLIFLDIKELITHVESVWENIDGWWNNQNLKTIREEFCYKYSVSPPKDAVKKFSKLLIKNA